MLLTSLSHFLCGLALLLSLALPATARHKRVARRHHHHVHLRKLKMLPTTIPIAREGYETVLRGQASWYGKVFQGRFTSSGERYDRFQFTCAHKTLPFGTRLRVTNVKNGMTAVVRVSDRGPFSYQRIIDLSERAAGAVGLTKAGTGGVVAVIVPDDTPLGVADTPTNLTELCAADPRPKAPFAAYLLSAPAQPSVADTERLAAVPSTPASTQPSETTLAPMGSVASSLPEQTAPAEATAIVGQPSNPLLLDQLDNWLAAEAVRRSLQARSLVAALLPRPSLLPSPTPTLLAKANELPRTAQP